MRKLAIGKILSSHGTRGFVKVRSFSGDTDHFRRLKTVYLTAEGGLARYAVEEVRISGARIVMKLRDVETPEAAKRLSGRVLWVARNRASRRRWGEYYVADLCKCGVYRDRRKLGEVTAVYDFGAGDILQVRVDTGKEVMIPLRKPFVRRIRIRRGRILLGEEHTET